MPYITTMVKPVYACGCEGRPQKDTEAGRAMVAAFALTDCFTCKRVREAAEAAAMAATLQLPDLEGTDKQTSYALTVREQIRQRIEQAYSVAEPEDQRCADAVLYGIRDAGWWLDRKDAEAYAVLEWIRPVVQIAQVS